MLFTVISVACYLSVIHVLVLKPSLTFRRRVVTKAVKNQSYLVQVICCMEYASVLIPALIARSNQGVRD